MWPARWDPFRELDQLHDRMNRLFEEGSVNVRNVTSSVGSTDIYEEGGKVVVETALPRFEKDDVELNVHEGRLEIKAIHKNERERKDRTYLRRESSLQSFYRMVQLPKGADGDNIAADFTNGVLKVTIPMKELPKPKKVAIASGDKKEEKK